MIAILRTTADGADAFGDGQKRETVLTLVNRAAKEVTCSFDLRDMGVGLDDGVKKALERAGITKAESLLDDEANDFVDGSLEITMKPLSVKIFRLA